MEAIHKITIEDNVISIEYGKFSTLKNVNDIHKIIDLGFAYYFVYSFPNKFLYCLCQKDLIKICNLENFEKVFSDFVVY